MFGIKPYPKTNSKKRTKRQAPFSTKAAKIAGFVGIVAVEIMIAGIIAATNKTQSEFLGVMLRIAYVEAIISLSLGLLGLLCKIAATQAKNDPRPEQQARAGMFNTAALVCVIIPALYLAEAKAFPKHEAEHKAYEVSGMLAVDKSILEGTWKDENGYGASRERYADARIAYEANGVAPTTAKLDWSKDLPEIFWGFVVYLLLTNIPGLLVQPAPETEAEAKRRIAKAEADERQARIDEITKKRNATIAAKNAPPVPEKTGIVIPFFGKKKAA